MNATQVGRPQCPVCHGNKKTICASCNGTKESAHINVEVCELCDENGEQICNSCAGVGFKKVASVDELIAWYAMGYRNFSGTAFPTDGRLSYRDLDLSGIDLTGSSLSGYQFIATNFSHGKLEKLDLRKTRLCGCNFQAANLFLAKMNESKIEGCRFVDASLQSADLSRTTLERTDFTRCDLSHAKLTGAELSPPVSPEVAEGYRDSRCANLAGAKLMDADLTGAELRDVSLEGADLRAVKGLHLDSNFIRGTRFSPGAPDFWSVLRRKYTGPMFAFHFFILICFLLPYGARTAYWVFVNDAQSITTQAAEKISRNLQQGAVAEEPALDVVLQTIASLKGCFSLDCRSVPIWRLLIGLDEGYANAVLPLALFLYNACRALLTWRVTLLREEEERSGFTPMLSSYRWLYPVHLTYSALIVVALSMFVWHLFSWLTLPVSVRALALPGVK
jgi:uncharacterized protein YjbI with pentapeptide repeats